MMTDTKFLRIIIVCLIVLNIGTLSYLLLNRPGNSRGPGGRERIIEFLSEELNFSSEQRAQVMKLHEENREQIEEIQAEDRKLHDHYFNYLNQNNPDSAVVDSMATLMSHKRKQIEIQTFYHFSMVRTICTEEQKAKFDRIINDALRMMAPRPPR